MNDYVDFARVAPWVEVKKRFPALALRRDNKRVGESNGKNNRRSFDCAQDDNLFFGGVP
jgi:hypothetical protein